MSSLPPRAAPKVTLDGDRPTVHIRCGGDIHQRLRQAGFAGAFLEFADPYVQGPVCEGDDFVDRRADFIAAAYGLDRTEVGDRLTRDYAALDDVAGDDRRVVLWFEHDPYDQLSLARVLTALADTAADRPLELICCDRFPGIARFIGLGQLSAADLAGLWPRRQPVTPAQITLGCAVWRALCAPNPTGLHAIAAPGTAALPPMAGALMRHLQELPWVDDGLSLTERLVLERLEDGVHTGQALFGALTHDSDPLPTLGDLMFWSVLTAMHRATIRPFEILDPPPFPPWPTRRVQLTPAGRKLLAGGGDWRDYGPPPRWLGGIRLAPDAPDWRWDPERAAPIRR